MNILTYENITDSMLRIGRLEKELAGIRSNLPKELGYTWETGTPKDHLMVDDGLELPFYLPWSLCSSAKVAKSHSPKLVVF